MTNSLANALAVRPYLVLDGALATELEERGANLDHPLWSAHLLDQAPELIRQVHHDYYQAGADIAITASYQATYPGMAAQGIDHATATALLQKSVELAKTARQQFLQAERATPAQHQNDPAPNPLVAASIGPYGAYLADGSEYRGDYGLRIDALMDFHRERLQTLIQAEPDLLACETIPCCTEAIALVQLLTEIASHTPDLPGAWISFACRSEEHLNSGESFEAAVRAVADSPHVAAIGINCTAPAYVEALLKRARRLTAKPLLVYPNRGETWDAARRCWIVDPNGLSPDHFVERWVKAGAVGIGGCCRTGPADIRNIAQALAHRFQVGDD